MQQANVKLGLRVLGDLALHMVQLATALPAASVAL
jgi:hypothetical protein